VTISSPMCRFASTQSRVCGPNSCVTGLRSERRNVMHHVDLSPAEQQFLERLPTGWGGRWYGVMVALVVDIKDPDNQGRVKVTLPWSIDAGGVRYEAWARLATMLGGNNRGSWFIPDVDDEVLVAFEHGDVRRPYVIGGLWNGKDQAPESMDGAGK